MVHSKITIAKILSPFLVCLLPWGAAGALEAVDTNPEPVVRAMPAKSADTVFQTITNHTFHPLNDEGTFTIDKELGEHGIAALNDRDWHVRQLVLHELIHIGTTDRSAVEAGLTHGDAQVRYLSAAALGILGEPAAESALSSIAHSDPSPLVRSQAIVALGQITATSATELLKSIAADDPVKDVRHQAGLSLDQIRKEMGTTSAFRQAWLDLDASTFETVDTGDRAPDFTLLDTEDRDWTLSEHLGEDWIALIWIFADWCPVCHGEFNELIELRAEFESDGIQPVTLETHDRYRARVMVGKEVEPDYWFADKSFQDLYTEKIWWPHLRDPAGTVGATYGIDPMAFAVHSEYINRPTVVILDPKGTVRFAYRGTYWGDRPSIREILEMVRAENFEYQHPKRLGALQK